MSGPTPIERLRQTGRLLRAEGGVGVANRARRRIARRIEPAGYNSRLAQADLLRAAEVARGGWALPAPLPIVPGEPMTIAWLTVPPGEGSGGHTTMFRIASALAAAGNRCIIYLIDAHGWALEQHERTIRSWWPWLDAEIRDAANGVEDAHAIFATSWETAYRVLAEPARGTRFYFVQDFEPWFYPAGSEALLAEATYRFGFHGLTAGRWLSGLLSEKYDMPADHFDFGRDALYAPDPSLAAEARAGICMFSRPETPRRATELAVMALELFAARHPEVEIHLFGQALPNPPFRVQDHGHQTPEQLNALYQRCVAGLVLSATNVSLVPHEMLAAGCIPVVNDAEHNRVVLDNDSVAYSGATPFELADTLSALIEQPLEARTAAAEKAAASVHGASWEKAGQEAVRVVRSTVEAAVGSHAG